MMKNQQIKAEWRNGKIFRTYDREAVELLEEVRMASPKTSGWNSIFISLLIVVLLVICVVAFRHRSLVAVYPRLH